MPIKVYKEKKEEHWEKPPNVKIESKKEILKEEKKEILNDFFENKEKERKELF